MRGFWDLRKLVTYQNLTSHSWQRGSRETGGATLGEYSSRKFNERRYTNLYDRIATIIDCLMLSAAVKAFARLNYLYEFCCMFEAH